MYTRILIATGGSPWSTPRRRTPLPGSPDGCRSVCPDGADVSGVYAMPDVMASSELLLESVEQQGQEMLATPRPAPCMPECHMWRC